MTTPLKPSAQRVQDALAERGFSNQVVEFSESTRTSAEAAAAVGCEVGQIAKSLIFQGATGHRPILVIASGDNRVNEKAMAVHAGDYRPLG
jgi:prolyl-tRNA editing enzyme YbaK/EbsC (Cys-tRNA(Pro) deacylase)